jgi:orotidine-5'-phosphate decarboxylase
MGRKERLPQGGKVTSMSKVIVALDALNEKQVLELAAKLSGLAWGFKINDQLLSNGAGLITKLKKFGLVFADAKVHDIPNTVGNSVKVLSEAGADLITVHASGGRAMLDAAVKNSGSARILAVTVLTSLGEQDTQQLFGCSVTDAVRKFSALASESGIHGIVCSAADLPVLSEAGTNAPKLKVTPGIRPSWYSKLDDQTRVMGPAEAVRAGAGLIVVGRPITESENPGDVLGKINQEIEDLK